MRKSAPWYVRTKADKRAIKEGCYFDDAAGEFVCEFIETFCVVSKGRKAGERFKLLPWQRELILLLYGWKNPDGTRRFKTAYVEIAKKNGKSTLVAALVLFEIIFGDTRGEIYLCARTKRQATIIYNDAIPMVKASPMLSDRLALHEYYKRLDNPNTGSYIEVLSGDAQQAEEKDGYDASVVIFDELHRQRDARLWNVMKYSGVARSQPIHLSITTAGDSKNSVCYEQHQRSKAILSGKNDWDTTHLAILHCASPKDNLDDPKTWKKANPSLGITLSEADFKRELEEAKQLPRNFDLFKRLRLNLWIEGDSPWLPMDRWHECKTTIDANELRGKECYAGLDLSKRIDLTALVLLFPHEDGTYNVLPWYWAPEDCADRRETLDKVPYRQWARAGYMTLTTGEVVSYEAVKEKLKELATIYQIKQIAADPFESFHLCEELRNEGYNVNQFRQSFVNFNVPCKELEGLLLQKKIKHPGNKVLDWNMGNVVVSEDGTGLLRPSRKKSTEKIDGAVCLLMALGLALDAKMRAGLRSDCRIIY